MRQPLRVAGLTDGSVDLDKKELSFTLSIRGRDPYRFVADFGAATQVIGALGRMWAEFRSRLDQQGGVAPISAEQVSASHVQKERWTDVVLLQLITPAGIPYSFAIPTRDAADIADRLKTESAIPTQTGSA